MQLADEILSLAGFHVDKVLQVAFAAHLAEKQ